MWRCALMAAAVWMVAPETAPTTAPTRLPAGGTLQLQADLVLSGADDLVFDGTAQQPCTVIGNGFSIRSATGWTGSARLRHCALRGLGKAGVKALDLTAVGEAALALEHCTFDASGAIALSANDRATLSIVGCTIAENGAFHVDKQPHLHEAALVAGGTSKARKVFQGNRVYRSSCQLRGGQWLIGGDRDAEGNLLIALRGGLFTDGPGNVIRRNYIRCLLPVSEDYPWWSQVSTLGPSGECSDNVIRDGHWVIRGVSGEFHHNVVLELHGHNHVQIGKGKVHHNIFAHPSPFPDRLGWKAGFGGSSAIHHVYAHDAMEIYNNVLDGTGAFATGIEVNAGSTVPSIRNNVFYNVRVGVGKPHGDPASQPADMPARMAYAEYNCFFNVQADAPVDAYQVGVAGKAERRDAGFASRDLPPGGAVDARVDPKFVGPLPAKFPFDDEDIKSGKVTVSQILKFYRDAYTPADGSPLRGAGDPRDGEGTDIGAVQVSPWRAPASASAPAGP